MLGIQKTGGDIGNDQATYCLGFAAGITLRKLVRSATLDVVDGSALGSACLSISKVAAPVWDDS